MVTPCVGVWIETNNIKGISKKAGSHPAWVCGLKLRETMNITFKNVTPSVAVRKETIKKATKIYEFAGKEPNAMILSNPAWVCGL